MDNILKLIVGCLGLVGLVVMIIPNSDPLANKKDDVTSATPASPDATAAANGAPLPPPPPPDPNATQQADTDNVVVEDYDIGSFGQPMIDPTPPGQRNQQPYQPPQYNSGLTQPGNGAQQAADAAAAAGAAADAAAQQAQQQSF
jgi:hypothetical protein